MTLIENCSRLSSHYFLSLVETNHFFCIVWNVMKVVSQLVFVHRLSTFQPEIAVWAKLVWVTDASHNHKCRHRLYIVMATTDSK